MAPAQVTVIYPKGTKFNMDYYLSSHMPFVGKTLKSHGLTGWKVLQFGDDSPYCVQATLEWAEFSHFEKASKTPDMAKVLEDVPNFSDQSPTLMAGHLVGTS